MSKSRLGLVATVVASAFVTYTLLVGAQEIATLAVVALGDREEGRVGPFSGVVSLPGGPINGGGDRQLATIATATGVVTLLGAPLAGSGLASVAGADDLDPIGS